MQATVQSPLQLREKPSWSERIQICWYCSSVMQAMSNIPFSSGQNTGEAIKKGMKGLEHFSNESLSRKWCYKEHSLSTCHSGLWHYVWFIRSRQETVSYQDQVWYCFVIRRRSSSGANKDDIISAGEAVLHVVCRSHQCQWSKIWKNWHCMKSAMNRVVVQPSSIPPTSAAVKYHSLRMYRQVQECLDIEWQDWDWKVISGKIL